MRGRVVVSTSGRCLIVMYHYVRPLPDCRLPFFRAMTLERFRAQIEHLAAEWTFVSLDEYIDGLAGKAELPDNCCVLTFDDGVRDHYEFVLPILLDLGIPAAFFVPTRAIAESYMLDVHMIQHLVARVPPDALAERLRRAVRGAAPDQADQFLLPDIETADRIYHYEPHPATRWTKHVMNFVLPELVRREVVVLMFREEFGSEEGFGHRFYLAPGQIREMAACGMIIGSHGHEHVAMSDCTREQKRAELMVSRQLLEAWVGGSVSTFCYPWGGSAHIDAESEDLLVEVGYRCGLTTLDGVNEGEVSPFYLRRRDCTRVGGTS